MLRTAAAMNEHETGKRKKEESSDEEEEEAEITLGGKLLADDENESDMDEDFEAMIKNDEDEEKRLESLVFGSETSIFKNIDKVNEKVRVKEARLEKQAEIGEFFENKKPAWKDEADQEIVDLDKFNQFSKFFDKNKVEASQIEEALKSRFTKYYGNPEWAELDADKKEKKKKNKKKKKNLLFKINKTGEDEEEEDEEEEEDSDEEKADYFQQTGNFLANQNSGSSLPKNIIDIKVCTDANKEEPQQEILKSVEFHPSARVILTGGLSQKLNLFQIDGKKNPKIQSIFIEKFPILAAHFTRNGDEIILGSRHKNFYYYDMNAGKLVTIVPPVKALDEFQRLGICHTFEISPDNRLIAFVGSQGQIHLFSAKSKEWIDTIKINGSCNAVTFSPDSRHLFAFGDDKEVYVFDMNDRGHRSLHRFNDHGCLSGYSIAVSNNSQFIATGCKSGVVNIYNLNECLVKSNRNPTPTKSFMNLTTPCTSLKFNSTSEILAASSKFATNACKLIHVGSMSVFSNFPLAKAENATAMRIPQSIDFSINSGYFAIGNNKGNALLYRLKHYGSF